ncbi:putative RTM1-like protein [Ilyonectria robusta]|uniref:putative RTM1-like protein n=1 Tax=Ilyonectria robusta TaxID=1079257 RepID=UPI001E8CFCCA|nr:putative RTM1-like protein [Ilyonectria robusta]KAH8736075.1 putative RTM1-like protein [Ilyonectria robusta]
MSTPEEEFKLYHYDPSTGAAVTFIIFFLAITGIHAYQMIRTKTWFFTAFIIGGCFQWIGYIGRAISSRQSPDWALGPYLIQSVLLLVSPALFAASIYMILGRIILLTDGEPHSIIRRTADKDLCAGIMASNSEGSMSRGERIVTWGLVVQVVVFSLFAVTASIFHKRMRQNPTTKVLAQNLPWQSHLMVLYGASLLIMVRSVFRLIEYAQGNDGYLISHEIFLYLFDSVLMFATMVVFAWYHPSEVYALLKGTGGMAVRRLTSVYSMA